jgi:hypothetical protein
MFSEALADFVASIIMGFMAGYGWYFCSCIFDKADSVTSIRFGGFTAIAILLMIGVIQIRQNWNKDE